MMYENLRKFEYTGDQPSPAVKADRMAKLAREKHASLQKVTQAVMAEQRVVKPAPKKGKISKVKIKKAVKKAKK